MLARVLCIVLYAHSVAVSQTGQHCVGRWDSGWSRKCEDVGGSNHCEWDSDCAGSKECDCYKWKEVNWYCEDKC